MTTWLTPTLQGGQVLLRPLGSQDADALWEDVQDQEGQRLTGTHHDFTYAEIAAYCTSRADQTDRLTFAICDAATNEYMGEVVLLDHDEPNRSAYLRIALASRRRGQGIGTAVLRLVLAHAFGLLALHRVVLEVYAFNGRAIRAYEKVGFRHEGRLRDALWWDGVPHDALVMAILATEWKG